MKDRIFFLPVERKIQNSLQRTNASLIPINVYSKKYSWEKTDDIRNLFSFSLSSRTRAREDVCLMNEMTEDDKQWTKLISRDSIWHRRTWAGWFSPLILYLRKVTWNLWDCLLVVILLFENKKKHQHIYPWYFSSEQISMDCSNFWWDYRSLSLLIRCMENISTWQVRKFCFMRLIMIYLPKRQIQWIFPCVDEREQKKKKKKK